MNHIHKELNLTPHDRVSVTLNKQANVFLVDSTNYQNYRRHRKFTYYGGLAKQTPYSLSAPRQGRWHLVIDTGGVASSIRYSITVN